MRMLREVRVNPPGRFRYSRDEMMFQCGWIHGELSNKLGPLADTQLKGRADSLLLLECLHIAKVNRARLRCHPLNIEMADIEGVPPTLSLSMPRRAPNRIQGSNVQGSHSG
jgi:hypothetical protein